MKFVLKKEIKNGDAGCCSIQPKWKERCPICKNEAKGVLSKTLNALLKDEAKQRVDALEGFSLCKTSKCTVVYFRGSEILTQEDVNVSIGFKDSAKVKNYCYCFGWTKDRIAEDIKINGKSGAIEDIQSKMKTIGCACEVKNPSGKCCQADVKELIDKINMHITETIKSNRTTPREAHTKS